MVVGFAEPCASSLEGRLPHRRKQGEALADIWIPERIFDDVNLHCLSDAWLPGCPRLRQKGLRQR